MENRRAELVKVNRTSISVNDIPSENISALGRLLFTAASEWFSKPENMHQYEVEQNEKAS